MTTIPASPGATTARSVGAPLPVAALSVTGLSISVRRSTVIDGVDLQAIIRQSTATVSENVMSDVRSQGVRADDMVSGFVDRLLGRQPEPT